MILIPNIACVAGCIHHGFRHRRIGGDQQRRGTGGAGQWLMSTAANSSIVREGAERNDLRGPICDTLRFCTAPDTR
jgi:hypothetical protein